MQNHGGVRINNSSAVVLSQGRDNPIREIASISKGRITIKGVTQAAQVRRLYFNFDNHVKAYMLAIPDVVFIIVFYNGQIDCKNVYLFYASEPVRATADMLYCPGLPNIHSDFRICLGSPEINRERSMGSQIQEMADYFWRSKFNNDLASNHYEPAQSLHPALSSPQIWAMATRKNRNFIRTVNWKLAFTLGRALENVMKKMLNSEGS